MRRELVLLAAGVLLASPALAQTEADLKRAFESKPVTVLLDMPATSQGVDIAPDLTPALDLKRYSDRVKRYGIALRKGESALVTKVKVNRNFIEFQIGGGGYGTFGDDDGSVAPTVTPKSDREKNLEKDLKKATDPNEQRMIMREIESYRRQREEQDQRNQVEAQRMTIERKAQIKDRALTGGSRFNVRYKSGVPGAALTADGLRRALAEWVDFEDAAPRTTAAPAADEGGPAFGLKKGMTLEEVEKLLGSADEASTRKEAGLQISERYYVKGDVTIRAKFVSGVLVEYTVSSK